MELIQTHAMISRTRATKNELVMGLTKTEAQVAQVQEKQTRLSFIGGLQDLHKDTTYKIFIELAHLLKEIWQ